MKYLAILIMVLISAMIGRELDKRNYLTEFSSYWAYGLMCGLIIFGIADKMS